MKNNYVPIFAIFLISFFPPLTSFSQCDHDVAITMSPLQDVFCPGEEVTLTATSGMDNYTWYYYFSDPDESVEYGSGSESITLNASEWAVVNFYVVATLDDCSEASEPVVWDGWVFSPIAISHDANTTICPGDSSVIENAFFGPVNFQWYHNFEAIPGANNSYYWVTEPGVYTLQASYEACPNFWLNSGVGPEFSFYPPVDPNIQLEGENTLTINAAVIDVQWFFEGEEIEGANGLSHEAEENGLYSITGIDQNGCMVSGEYLFNSSSVNELENSDFVIYPNPVAEKLMVNLQDIQLDIQTVKIYDITGRLIRQAAPQPAQNSLLEISTNDLPAGQYILSIADGSKNTLKRYFIKE